MASEEPATSLAGLGEFAVIDRLVAGRDQPPVVAVGPGDDAAVVVAADGKTVVSTDMLVEGRHFRLDWSSPRDVGRKAIAQNAADIEAMGAAATAFVVAFGAPAHVRGGAVLVLGMAGVGAPRLVVRLVLLAGPEEVVAEQQDHRHRRDAEE